MLAPSACEQGVVVQWLLESLQRERKRNRETESDTQRKREREREPAAVTENLLAQWFGFVCGC